jgi:hypothetical protein
MNNYYYIGDTIKFEKDIKMDFFLRNDGIEYNLVLYVHTVITTATFSKRYYN